MNLLLRRASLGIIFVIVVLILRFSGLGSYINLEYFRANSEQLQLLVREYYGISALVFLSTYVITVLCSIPITPELNIAGGYFFGLILGGLFSILGGTIGALLSFFMFRYLLRNYVHVHYAAKLEKFNKEFKKQGLSYLLFMQLLPITPFGVITIIAGLSDISWWTFVWATALGITPGSFIYAFAGQQLMTMQKPSDIFSWPIIISLILLALFSIVPIIIRHVQKYRSFYQS
jgi:uncharacterized membrane protein YdjX (TVP38/TMEM64 family)